MAPAGLVDPSSRRGGVVCGAALAAALRVRSGGAGALHAGTILARFGCRNLAWLSHGLLCEVDCHLPHKDKLMPHFVVHQVPAMQATL